MGCRRIEEREKGECRQEEERDSEKEEQLWGGVGLKEEENLSIKGWGGIQEAEKARSRRGTENRKRCRRGQGSNRSKGGRTGEG